MYDNIFEYFHDVVVMARHICLINVSYLQLSELLFKLVFLKNNDFQMLSCGLWRWPPPSLSLHTSWELQRNLTTGWLTLRSVSQSDMSSSNWVFQVRTASSRSFDNLLDSLSGRPGDDNHSAETQRMVDSRSGSGAQTSEVSSVHAL